MRFIASYLAGFLVTFFLLWFLRPLALRIGLIDVPGERKQHTSATPLIGGLAMFVGFAFAALTLDISLSPYRSFFEGLVVLIVVGVLDDMHDLSSYAKFLAQIIAALFMALWGGVALEDLGRLSGSGTVELGGWAIPFTVFSAVGVINALNMIDGLDGLAGSLALVALASLSFALLHAGHGASAHLLLIAVAVVVAFLLFNLRLSERRPARVFMGDSGSMFLGFVLTWYVIGLSQGPGRVIAPVTALWVLAIPLFDAVYIMFRRMLMGLSPFAADRDHLHHLLQALGFSAVQTLLVIVTAAVALALFGLYGLYHGFSEARMFYGFLALFALYFIAMNLTWWRLRIKNGT